jgi:biotin carboxyl carrier protein
MIFEVDLAGRTRTVSIERAGQAAGTYRVAIDGQPHLVNAVRVGEFGLSLMVTATFLAEAGQGGSGSDPFSGHITTEPQVPVPFSPRAADTRTTVIAREVQVTPTGRAGEMLVSVGGRVIAATANGRRTGRAAADAAGGSHGEQVVRAPMPGRVVRVLVSAGDTVAARQGVVVVEAMKMENELRSPRAGRVKEVPVAAGAAVEAGRVLVVIE